AEWAAEWTSKEKVTAIVRSYPGSLAKWRGFPDFLYLRVRRRPLLSGLETWVCKRDRRREMPYPRRGVHIWVGEFIGFPAPICGARSRGFSATGTVSGCRSTLPRTASVLTDPGFSGTPPTAAPPRWA